MNASEIRNIAVATLSNELFNEFEARSANIEARAERGDFPKFGHTTAQVFETAEEWMLWKLQDTLEDLQAEMSE